MVPQIAHLMLLNSRNGPGQCFAQCICKLFTFPVFPNGLFYCSSYICQTHKYHLEVLLSDPLALPTHKILHIHKTGLYFLKMGNFLVQCVINLPSPAMLHWHAWVQVPLNSRDIAFGSTCEGQWAQCSSPLCCFNCVGRGAAEGVASEYLSKWAWLVWCNNWLM